MPQMRAASAAGYLHSPHTMRSVRMRLYRARKRGIERRPARARIEFGVRGEQGIPACGACICPIRFFVEVLAGKCHLGSLLAQYLVLLRRERLLPVFFGFR